MSDESGRDNPDAGPSFTHRFDCTHNPCRCASKDRMDRVHARYANVGDGNAIRDPFTSSDGHVAGDVVYRWWKSNGGKNDSYDQQRLTIVRVNRCTVTVRTDQGSTFRMSPADIAGRWTDAD